MTKYVFLLLLISNILLSKTYVFSGGTKATMHVITQKILLKAYSEANISTKFIYTNLEQSLINSNNGTYDGEIARIKDITKKYKNLVIVPISTITIEAIAFSKNKNLHIKSWDDLKNKNFLIVRGVKFIENATKDIKKEYADSFSEALKMLNDDKIEIVVVPKLSGLTSIYQNQYKDIKMVSKSLKSVDLYHFVHKKNKHLVKILTPILQKMQDRNEMLYIKRSYLRSLTH